MYLVERLPELHRFVSKKPLGDPKHRGPARAGVVLLHLLQVLQVRIFGG